MSRVAVFAPNPLLTVTVEARGGRDDVHLHAAGQGVWVSRMAAVLGAEPVLCGALGGETGAVIEGLLARAGLRTRIVRTNSANGCLVADRRSGERTPVAQSVSDTLGRHEVDDLLSATIAEALDAAVLAVCNPFPADAIPHAVYAELVADAGGNGVPVVVDLSTPRLDEALRGGPALAKLNDWELAEYVRGPVDGPLLLDAARRLREAGAARVLVTRADAPALLLDGDEPCWVVPPRFERGRREGCGDTMLGAICAAVAAGEGWLDAVRLGTAAGAANFLRGGLGSGDRGVVGDLLAHVEVRAYADGA